MEGAPSHVIMENKNKTKYVSPAIPIYVKMQ